MPNRLAQESSPYLLQHAQNPVDWFAWGPEALEKARREAKPIFLSIGYSACHWCHVMEHESFENPRIAALLNEHFVSIKVDREERPDLDQIYMTAVQLMTGHGGWPMSVFLTPDGQPFYGGTYWPETARGGMPGFDQILAAVHDAWINRRAQAQEHAAKLTDYLRGAERQAQQAGAGKLSVDLLRDAARSLEGSFDFRNGGFGRAPKFPHAMDLRMLLRVARRNKNQAQAQSMATTTLDKIAAGGIYDHLGGGFHRYSVDERWLVPHFEKMLYDNALLALAYLEGSLATGNAEYARVACETLDYVLRDMTDSAGGFYSTEDADSEGHEGKFYVWTAKEIGQALGAEKGDTFCYVYGVTESGNFEGSNILNLPKTIEQCAKIRHHDVADLTAELADDRAQLLKARQQRVPPGRDDKVLVSWNGLMIDALAQVAAAWNEPRYLAAATKAADFLLSSLRRSDGRLLHSWRQGQAKLDAYLDDYACLINALVSLYEAGFDERYVDEAVRLTDIVLAQFADPAGAGFFFTAADHETLVARTKDVHDSSVPSATSMMTTVLVRLGHMTGRADYLSKAEATLKENVALLARAPAAAGQMLLALDMYLGPTPEIALLGSLQSADTAAALADLRRRFLPNKIVALRSPSGGPHAGSALDALFANKTAREPEPTVFVCQNFTCEAPVSGRAAAIAAWDKLDAG